MNGDDPRQRAATLATVSSGVLIVVKIALALLTGSVAVLAEATHAASELLRTIAAGVAARSEPAGERPIVETGALEGGLVIVAGVVAGFAALRSLGDAVARPELACAGLFACAIASRLVAGRVGAVAVATGSRALAADAASLRTSQSTAAGAGAALALGLLIDNAVPDAVAGVAIALVIVRGGLDLLASTRPGRGRLTGAELARIAEVLAAGPDEVIGYGRVGARSTRGARRIDVEVTVRRDVDDRRLGTIGGELEAALADRLRGVRTVVHLHKPPDPSAPREPRSGRGRS